MGKVNVEVKEFMGMDVRVIENEWMVLKDMFSALGRVRINGGWTHEKKKLLKFLEELGKKDLYQTSVDVPVKKGQLENVECLKLEITPLILTQFKPTGRKSVEALNEWYKFMKFVDDILVSLEVHKFIVKDKGTQREQIDRLSNAKGDPKIANMQVNMIMAKLIGVYDQGIKRVKKEELRVYKDQTTVDLLEVREFVMEKFINAYEFTRSHKSAGEMALKLAKEKYSKGLNLVA
ncbi:MULTISPECIES: hypothetical protein [Robinsoniella]|uniref:hypothetical protein n=1 Tax=Robinsoniella TaxID=588605 RepID=UPI00048004C4|nr:MULTISPECIES: hypothetical protein [Robinsoniella]